MTPDSPRIVVTARGKSLLYRGKHLLSAVEPAAAGERLAAALPKEARTLYLCVSPLFGYGLERLLDTMHPDSAVLCVETERTLADFTRAHIPAKITAHPRFAFAADIPARQIGRLVQTTWGKRAFRRVVRFDLSAGASLHAAWYTTCEDTLRREIALEWENAATLIKLGRRYSLNFLRNLRLLDTLPSVETFPRPAGESLPTGANPRLAPPPTAGESLPPQHPPVYVLGAGPSLDSFFSDYRGGTIICVDTALRALHAHDLKAALVVALEAQHWNLRDFTGCAPPAALAMDMSTLPATAGIACRTYLFFTRWTPLRLFDRLSPVLPLEMPPLGNVGITALALARRLFPAGVTPRGLDFAFTIDQYHCRDSPGHIDRLRTLDRFHSPLPVEAALRPATFPAVNEYGEAVRRDPVMREYRTLYESVRRNPLPGALATVRRTGKTAAHYAVTLHAELLRIRGILGGAEKAAPETLAALLDENDYLFAHYPEYAGTGNPPNVGDLSFLKRIRAEIDTFIKAVDSRPA
jgi:hypothetical protein